MRREHCSRKKDLWFFQDASRKVFLPFWLDREKWDEREGDATSRYLHWG